MAKPTQQPACSPAGEGAAFVLFTDGGSRGNPGPAAAGVVLADAAGKTVYRAGHHLGRATSNVAEYRAAILGLTEALRRGARQLTFCSDSELLVRQLNGEYRVKSPALKPLHAEVRRLLERIGQVEVRHVRREQNAVADKMVNQALDARAHVGDAAAGAGGGAPGAGDAAATRWPPATFVTTCTADGGADCPAVVSTGGRWAFDGATPPGLCVHAAAGILAAVHAAAPGSAAITASCALPGCGARFRIAVGNVT